MTWLPFTSGHQLDLQPGQPTVHAAGGPPMAFSAPGGEEPPLVVDFAVRRGLYASSPHLYDIAHMAPGLVLHSIGLGEVCQAWGGLLAGLPLDPQRVRGAFAGANQGALIITYQIALFMDASHFKREMDAYARTVAALQPFPGLDRAYLAGGVQAAREEVHWRDGILLGAEHRAELSLPLPWLEAS